MVGLDSERRGIERAGARLVWIDLPEPDAVDHLRGAPALRRRPGSATTGRRGCSAATRGPRRNWGSMHIAGRRRGGLPAGDRVLARPAAAPGRDRAASRALASPFRTAEATGQDVIDPRETRALLAEFVDDAQRVLATQLGPPPVPYRP